MATENDINKAILLALNRTYLREIIRKTPTKTGETKKQWEIVNTAPFEYSLVNPAETANGKYSIIDILEFGTKPHIIIPKNKESLRWKDRKGEHFAKKIRHPGFEGRMFIKKIMNSAKVRKDFEDTFFKLISKKL